eukprot:TRINITY_DN260_c0_g2_i1.p1 TRINITY_DN260_c0_g2~~TRINITY_DN260_c0_g2_i1.p1  ORF type:complete len:528 (-),score=40.98 TRINITY_DN260_c0_g2_i1:282-1865(-)
MASSFWWEISNQNHPFARSVFTVFITLIPILVCYATWVYKNGSRKKETPPLPPGPRGLPLVGNLPFLDPDIHRCFADLSRTYGPIIKIKLGMKTCIVVISAPLAQEILRDHDTIFANRAPLISALTITYDGSEISWSPYGAEWRNLRMVCVQELLSNVKLDASYAIRRQEMRQTVTEVYAKAGTGTPVDLGDLLFQSALNVMTSLLWGNTLNGDEMARIRAEFGRVLVQIMGTIASPNISDLIPFLAPFDLQGVERRAKRIFTELDRILNSIIDVWLKLDIKEEDGQKDFLHNLFDVKSHGEHRTPFTNNHIKGLLMDMLGGGTSTTANAAEWAMAELLQHPHIMRKVQKELDEVVGMNSVVEESHFPKLKYLDAVIKETLRLHPAGPFLIPRSPTSSCVVGGYTIPKGVRVMVNIWAIHRDPEYWNNPLEFYPERFLHTKWDYNGNGIGNDCRYLPFGAGRRICVGLPIAEKMMMHNLASLLHSFDWLLLEGTKLDFSEKFDFAMKKATPTIAIPTPRLCDPNLYT